MKQYLGIFTVALTFISAPASAQFNGGMDWVVNRTRTPVIIQCPGCNADGDDDDGSVFDIPDVPATKLVSLDFSPSMERRKQNLSRIAKDTLNNDPATIALLQKGDIIGQMDQMMQPMGLRADNVADAYTIWWVAAWHAVHKKPLEPDNQIFAAVKQQALNALLSTPAIASASDAQKQELAESLLIQTLLIDTYIDGTAGNAAQQAELAKAVNKGAKQMGLDLTTMDLTENGFVPRSGKRSDASDVYPAAPEGADTQMAANDNAGATESDNGKLALYGVGGVALLAGMFALGKSFGNKG